MAPELRWGVKGMSRKVFEERRKIVKAERSNERRAKNLSSPFWLSLLAVLAAERKRSGMLRDVCARASTGE